MKTIRYNTLAQGTFNLIGDDYDKVQTVEWRLIRDFINNRLSTFWRAAKWPELTVIESRVPTQTGDVEGNYVSLTQPGQTEIGEVFGVYNKSPKQYKAVTDLTWNLSANGIQIAEANTPVFVFYRTVKPEITGEKFSSSTAYSAGDQVYDIDQGNFFTANATTTAGQSPTSTPSKWDIVEIPYISRNYLIYAAYADYLRHNQMMDQSHPAMRSADRFLDEEIMLLQTQQGQTTQTFVRTY